MKMAKQEITDYILVVGCENYQLSVEVCKYMELGWQPLGPAQITVDANDLFYAQTMVMYNV